MLATPPILDRAGFHVAAGRGRPCCSAPRPFRPGGAGSAAVRITGRYPAEEMRQAQEDLESGAMTEMPLDLP